MTDVPEIRLPATNLGSNRHFSIGTNMHGDLSLAFRNGEDEQKYYLAHSSDAALFGSMIGYWVRLGMNEPAIRETFIPAAESILSEMPEERIWGRLSTTAVMAAMGTPRPSFDRPELNWLCLMTPTPMAPGSDLVGGTGVYTTEADQQIRLVIARTLAEDASLDEERAAATYLGPLDAPLVARAVAENAMGEYRDNISALIKKRFPEL